jgi:hypothetical protein
LIEKPLGAVRLAPATDRRKAINPGAGDFDQIEEADVSFDSE